MTVSELAEFLHITKAAVYQLTHAHKIPYYTPTGRKVLFKRSEMIAYAEQGRIASVEEITSRAANELMQKGGAL